MTQTLLDWLIAQFPTAKRQTLKRMVEAKRVTVNGRPATTLKVPIREGDQVAVDQRTKEPPTPPPQIRVIHEDEDVLVLDKPAGLLTSTVPNEPRPTLWAMARDYVQSREGDARVGLIHRLDRDVSGLLVFSKNDLAYQSLKTQFYDHSVHREYTAIVHGKPIPAAGKMETHLVERADGSVRSTRQIGKGQVAITNYEVVETLGKMSLVRVILQTGRKHQIRVHLSEKGWPIIGDRMYGQEEDKAPRLMLASTKLTIVHPRTNKEMTFAAPLPKEMRVVLHPDGPPSHAQANIKKLGGA